MKHHQDGFDAELNELIREIREVSEGFAGPMEYSDSQQLFRAHLLSNVSLN